MIDHRHCSLPATLAVIAAMVTSGAVLAQAPKVVLPPKGFVADPARVAALFQKHCIECHGRDARGTGRGPSLLHPGYRPEHHSDLAFYIAIQQGVGQHHWSFGDMKAVPALSPEEAGHVIGWIRSEQRKAGGIR
jgi:mono/diheme cytochrome c family protein